MLKVWEISVMRAGPELSAGWTTQMSSSDPMTQTVSGARVTQCGRESRARCSHSPTASASGISMRTKNTAKKSSEFTASSVRKERPMGSAKIGTAEHDTGDGRDDQGRDGDGARLRKGIQLRWQRAPQQPVEVEEAALEPPQDPRAANRGRWMPSGQRPSVALRLRGARGTPELAERRHPTPSPTLLSHIRTLPRPIVSASPRAACSAP